MNSGPRRDWGAIWAWRFLALLFLGALLSPLRAQQFAGFTYNVEYAEDNSPYIRITQYTGPGGAVTIPKSITASIQGTPVDVPVHRLSSTFLGNATVTSVTIPDGVKSIGSWTFSNCRGLTSINIPSSVTSIGMESFQACSELTEISIPDSVLSIGRGAFSSCRKVVRVKVGDGVTTIGASAFSGCSALSELVLGNNVVTIEDNAFTGCQQLDLVTLPASVATIQSRAFSQCGANILFTGNAPTTVGTQAFPGFARQRIFFFNSNTGFTSPSWQGYHTIGVDGFQDEFAFTSDGDSLSIVGYRRSARVLRIPATLAGLPVRRLGPGAFAGHSALTSIELPDSITSIGESAFSGCTSLTQVSLGLGIVTIGIQAFQDCAGLTNLNLPLGVTAIGDSAFSGCSGLTGVTIPENVATMGANTFGGCTALRHAIFDGDAPDAFFGGDAAPGFSVYFRNNRAGFTAPTWSGNRAIAIDGQHENLTYASDGAAVTINGYTGPGGPVVIPEIIAGLPVRTISGAFYQRRDLTSVIIPADVTSLDAQAFYDCHALRCLVFEGNAPDFPNADVFPRSLNSLTVCFRKGSTGFESPKWEEFRKLAIDGRVGDYTYSIDNDTVTVNGYVGPGGSVIIPEWIEGLPVRRMEEKLFWSNKSVTSVSISDSVTSIGSRAFQECDNLTRVTIGNGVTSIGYWAFANCWNLTDLTIGNSVQTIEYWAFYNCRSLTRILIPDSVNSIDDGAFFECANLVEVTLGQGVTSIGDSAFSRCPDLVRATFTGDAPALVGEMIFSDSSSRFVVYHSPDSLGFTSPTWQGYASVALTEPPPMPLETWRRQHFGDQATNSGVAADAADPDGDGETNLEEFAAGTNPHSATDTLQFPIGYLSGTTIHFTIRALPDRLYELQRLIPGPNPHWQSVDSAGPVDTATGAWLTDNAAPSHAAIYRVVCRFDP